MLYTARVTPVGYLRYSVCSLRLEFYLQYFWHNSINMEYLNALQTPTVQLTSNLKRLKSDDFESVQRWPTLAKFNIE